MTNRIAKTGTTLVALFALSACGGGGDIPVQPLSSTGFARGGETISGGDSFTANQANIIRQNDTSNSGVPKTVQEDIGITIQSSGRAITLALQDGDYELTNPANDSFYFVDVGTRRIFLDREIVNSGLVETSAIGIFDTNGPDSYAYVTYGFDTDPDTIAATTGQASYSGEVIADVEGKSRIGIARGLFDMDVGFDTMKVTGQLTLVDDGEPVGSLVIPTTRLDLADTTISQNGFSGTLTGTPSGGAFTGVRVGDAKIEGRFFGANGEAIGGDFTTTLEDTSGAASFAIQGGFNGERD